MPCDHSAGVAVRALVRCVSFCFLSFWFASFLSGMNNVQKIHTGRRPGKTPYLCFDALRVLISVEGGRGERLQGLSPRLFLRGFPRHLLRDFQHSLVRRARRAHEANHPAIAS